MAHSGEFTKQALINNKLDISQSNSINYLIKAKTDIQHDVSLNIILGNAKNKIKLITEKLFQYHIFCQIFLLHLKKTFL